MSHPENKSMLAVSIDQLEALTRESFRMAERIVGERVKQVRWTSDDARDRYLSVIPILAIDLKNQLAGVAQTFDRASEKDIEEMNKAFSGVLAEVKRRNDQHEESEGVDGSDQ